MICDIEPHPDSHRIGPVAAGKLLARKHPHLLPVYDSRVKKVLNRPRTVDGLGTRLCPCGLATATP
jgi:hypothetical protein